MKEACALVRNFDFAHVRRRAGHHVNVPRVLHGLKILVAKKRHTWTMASQSGTAVLGAWGCGVFKNDPGMVAEVFHEHLSGEFATAFDRVVFAIPGKHTENYQAFADVFGTKETR